MAPVSSSRHYSQTTASRHSSGRDYRPHIRFDERSRRDGHYDYETKRKRRSSSRSDEDRRQRRRVNDDRQPFSSKGSEHKKQQHSESHEDDLDQLDHSKDSHKSLAIKFKSHTMLVKEVLAKSFGLSKSKLSKLVTDRCDQKIRDEILAKSKNLNKLKSANTSELSQSSKTATDEVHLCDQNFQLDDDGLDEAPNNDYSQHFVNSAHRPQNFIRDAGLYDRFEEYPKLRELIRLKDDFITKTSSPPMYLRCDILANNFTLASLDHEFDVILIEPPLEEYKRFNGIHFDRYVNWDEIMKLDVESIAAQRSFVFLWCGSEDGLDQGRLCLKKWGFRRCEDICWVKTNRTNKRLPMTLESNSIFQRTKEHCLMGIRGTVRRSLDSDFIHANVDIDLIITEEPEWGDPNKPIELFHIIEHFCLGRRRLHLFARESTIRRGWLSIGSDIRSSNFDKRVYKSYFEKSVPNLEALTERIEQLRPKSPPPKGTKGTPAAGTTNSTATLNNNNANSASTAQMVTTNTNSGLTKDMTSSSNLQDGPQAIRSTITSNRQSSSRSTRPQWTLYSDELGPSNYSPMMLSPPRHQYSSSSYSDLYLLSEYDYAITAGSANQNDYDAYYGHNTSDPADDRGNFRN